MRLSRSIAALGLTFALTSCGPVTSTSAAVRAPVDAGTPFSNAGRCHAVHAQVTDPQAWLPDPSCTPGAIDGGLSRDQLCPVAHTKQIRPPASYTEPIKRAQMQDYGATGAIGEYEEDHLISLELGGAPRDKKNLWPEPHRSPNEKDLVEGAAHTAVCHNQMDLATVQRRIATDWRQLGRDLGVIKP
jgi:hypothetical protein